MATSAEAKLYQCYTRSAGGETSGEFDNLKDAYEFCLQWRRRHSDQAEINRIPVNCIVPHEAFRLPANNPGIVGHNTHDRLLDGLKWALRRIEALSPVPESGEPTDAWHYDRAKSAIHEAEEYSRLNQMLFMQDIAAKVSKQRKAAEAV